MAVLCGIQVLGGRRKKPYEHTMEGSVQSDGRGRVNSTGQSDSDVAEEGSVAVSGASSAASSAAETADTTTASAWTCSVPLRREARFGAIAVSAMETTEMGGIQVGNGQTMALVWKPMTAGREVHIFIHTERVARVALGPCGQSAARCRWRELHEASRGRGRRVAATQQQQPPRSCPPSTLHPSPPSSVPPLTLPSASSAWLAELHPRVLLACVACSSSSHLPSPSRPIQ